MKPFKFLFPLIAIASIFTACGDDENEPPQTTIVVPDGAPSLNMMNENNGKSIVANTDVYLDQNNNFISPNDYLIYCTKNFGMFNPPFSLEQIFSQVTVFPNNVYHLYPKTNIYVSTNGRRAIAVGTKYINVYIDSWIKKGKEIVGAKVHFKECTIESQIKNSDIVRLSFATPGKELTSSLYASEADSEFEILSITSDDSDNLLVELNLNKDILQIKTIGPVTATIQLRKRVSNVYAIHTIHVKPETPGVDDIVIITPPSE